MFHPTTRAILMLTVAALVAGQAAPLAAGNDIPAQPRLVVLIVIDQLRADFITRFERHFAEDGFRRLMRDGAHFANAYFSYGSTATAPGHATIITGRIPRQHGIVANKWYLDPGNDRPQYAIDDPASRGVPPDSAATDFAPSPRHLIGPTLGDQMKLSDARSRVFSVALKDRAAVFMAGHRPDAAYWWDLNSGRFVSSTYYCDTLPPYISDFNEKSRPGLASDPRMGKSWDRLLPPEHYDGCHQVDPAWSQDDFSFLGPAFPHVLPAASLDGSGPNHRYFDALWVTPFGNDLVLDIVERILTHERIGRGPACDLLCIGLSSVDLCGHYFGPESPELMDMMLHTDRQTAALLALLDRQVGLKHCIIAVTGDHGATTAPPLSRRLGLGGGIIDPRMLARQLNEHLLRLHAGSAAAETGDLVRAVELPWVYFNRPRLASFDSDQRGRVLKTAADFLRSAEGVADVFTEGDLSGPMPAADDLHRHLAWRCYHPDRSGELYLQLEPLWYKLDDKISGHNMGFNHDRHVPIILTGPRIRPGRYFSPARPCDIAVTISAMLGIEPPLDAVGRVLHEALDTHP